MYINYQDLEQTTAKTRAKHAARWKNCRDWPKVIDDMIHCASFNMRDELVDLLSDSLVIVDTKGTLAPDLKKEWEAVIVEAKSVPKASDSVGSIQRTKAALMRCGKKMAHVMTLYSERTV